MFEKIKNVTESAFDAVLIVSNVGRRYITGFKSSAGYVAVTKEKTFFITDFRYIEAAKKHCKQGIEVILQEKVFEQLSDIFSSCKNILIEENYFTLSDYETIKNKLSDFNLVKGASTALERLRAVKSKEELSFIKKAQSITDLAFSHILNYISDNIQNGITEKDVALELDFFMLKNGADGLAFDTIAVSGVKSSMPHGVPENIPLSKGFLTMDFGATFNGYASDMTRTICIGKPTSEMEKVYNTVLEAQKRALENISPTFSGKEIDAVARDYINSCGYNGKFGHSLGHSLGLEIHELPSFSPLNDKKIPVGAVVSVEPGIYLEGEFGVRIEDIVYVTQTNCENLTNSLKDLIIL